LSLREAQCLVRLDLPLELQEQLKSPSARAARPRSRVTAGGGSSSSRVGSSGSPAWRRRPRRESAGEQARAPALSPAAEDALDPSSVAGIAEDDLGGLSLAHRLVG